MIKTIHLIQLIALLTLAVFAGTGCSKDGSKSKIMDGGEIQLPQTSEPSPTDGNMPEPGEKQQPQ